MIAAERAKHRSLLISLNPSAVISSPFACAMLIMPAMIPLLPLRLNQVITTSLSFSTLVMPVPMFMGVLAAMAAYVYSKSLIAGGALLVIVNNGWYSWISSRNRQRISALA